MLLSRPPVVCGQHERCEPGLPRPHLRFHSIPVTTDPPNLQCRQRTLREPKQDVGPVGRRVSLLTKPLLLLASRIQKEAISTQASTSSLVTWLTGAYSIAYIVQLDDFKLDFAQTMPRCVAYTRFPGWITRVWDPFMRNWARR